MPGPILGIGGSNATQIAGKYNGFVTPACSRESEPAPFAASLKRRVGQKMGGSNK